MPQSFSSVYIHIIFSTKNREPMIPAAIECELYNYISKIVITLDCRVLKINSVSDHVHILLSMNRTTTIAQILEEIKKRSSKWIKTKGCDLQSFQWQTGYGVFSVSYSKIDIIKKYIEDQKEHHKTVSFKEEYIRFLKENNIPYDERYVWD